MLPNGTEGNEQSTFVRRRGPSLSSILRSKTHMSATAQTRDAKMLGGRRDWAADGPCLNRKPCHRLHSDALPRYLRGIVRPWDFLEDHRIDRNILEGPRTPNLKGLMPDPLRMPMASDPPFFTARSWTHSVSTTLVTHDHCRNCSAFRLNRTTIIEHQVKTPLLVWLLSGGALENMMLPAHKLDTNRGTEDQSWCRRWVDRGPRYFKTSTSVPSPQEALSHVSHDFEPSLPSSCAVLDNVHTWGTRPVCPPVGGLFSRDMALAPACGAALPDGRWIL